MTGTDTGALEFEMDLRIHDLRRAGAGFASEAAALVDLRDRVSLAHTAVIDRTRGLLHSLEYARTGDRRELDRADRAWADAERSTWADQIDHPLPDAPRTRVVDPGHAIWTGTWGRTSPAERIRLAEVLDRHGIPAAQVAWVLDPPAFASRVHDQGRQPLTDRLGDAPVTPADHRDAIAALMESHFSSPVLRALAAQTERTHRRELVENLERATRHRSPLELLRQVGDHRESWEDPAPRLVDVWRAWRDGRELHAARRDRDLAEPRIDALLAPDPPIDYPAIAHELGDAVHAESPDGRLRMHLYHLAGNQERITVERAAHAEKQAVADERAPIDAVVGLRDVAPSGPLADAAIALIPVAQGAALSDLVEVAESALSTEAGRHRATTALERVSVTGLSDEQRAALTRVGHAAFGAARADVTDHHEAERLATRATRYQLRLAAGREVDQPLAGHEARLAAAPVQAEHRRVTPSPGVGR